MAHKQVWTKVNAAVDEGVVELIEALSSFPKLETFESCQGDSAEPPSKKEGVPARIWFQYGQHDHAHPYHDLAEFVLGYLGPGLMKELGDLVSIELRVDAEYRFTALLTVRQGVVPRATKTIKRLRREFEGSVDG